MSWSSSSIASTLSKGTTLGSSTETNSSSKTVPSPSKSITFMMESIWLFHIFCERPCRFTPSQSKPAASSLRLKEPLPFWSRTLKASAGVFLRRAKAQQMRDSIACNAKASNSSGLTKTFATGVCSTGTCCRRRQARTSVHHSLRSRSTVPWMLRSSTDNSRGVKPSAEFANLSTCSADSLWYPSSVLERTGPHESSSDSCKRDSRLPRHRSAKPDCFGHEPGRVWCIEHRRCSASSSDRAAKYRFCCIL
mmetsp:Transcript_22093/g.75750  ORF Transcript_22093/g.75750 Transcript_22093/m.75750 type:complete len:250 (+) Transcript_22093:2044-2793(+)